jgi:tetratricopeptide (TPR) repeat protein
MLDGGQARPPEAGGGAAARWCALAVGVAVALVYLPSVRSALVSYDDFGYVVENAHLRPFRFELLGWALTDLHTVNLWIPATFVSLALDEAVLGPSALGHHLVNAVLHGIGAALVVLLALEVERSRRREAPAPARGAVLAGAAAAALAWGLHPLRVESVAWVTERKDVLCGAASLLATVAWLRYARGLSRRWWALAVLAHALALMAKPTAVALPVAWLLLDVWPLRRTGLGAARLLAEKAPSLLASAAVGVVTVQAQRAVLMPLDVAPATRLLVAAANPAAYVALTFWPAGLHPLWPYPTAGALSAWRVACAAATVLVTAVLVVRARRRPGLCAAWLGFLLFLVPNVGVIQAGGQELADRFTYLAAVPLSLVAGAAVAAALSSRWRRAAAGLAACALAALATVTVLQQRHWRDSVAFWTRNVRFEPESGYSWSGLGDALLEEGRLDESLAALARSLEIARRKGYGDVAQLHAHRAAVAFQAGRLDDALEDTRLGLVASRRPELALLQAEILDAMGRPAEAAEARALATALQR